MPLTRSQAGKDLKKAAQANTRSQGTNLTMALLILAGDIHTIPYYPSKANAF